MASRGCEERGFGHCKLSVGKVKGLDEAACWREVQTGH